ncbi:hypothetical protein [Mongoliitalea daihaiensis]|uniref:hypothetical protein n=1 Tax=Mongoliitalea daihaiensis TaxID=2782006 RepID=UPI001F393AB1|nr:hypothetical protein [Mongoliitalea daihaiensis]UJP65913.1 hypothetical protein IPZ59_04630 [Mongoliitalea daihaiensis]
MKINSLFLLLVFLLVSSCKDEAERPRGAEDPEVEAILPKMEVAVRLADGVSLDIAELEVMSYGQIHSISGSGVSAVSHNPGAPFTAFVFDTSDRLVLAGFLSDSRKELSVRSTAEYLLFLGFDMQAEGGMAREKFIREVSELPVFDTFLSELELLYKTDPYTLDKGLYVNALRKAVSEIYAMAQPEGRIAGRVGEEEEVAGDVLVDANIKSYLQVFDTGLNRFRITHRARRRVKGFLYRTSYVDKSGVSHTLIEDISASSAPDQVITIPPVSGVKDFAGTLVDFLVGKISETASVDTDDLVLPLKSDERSVKSVLRVIGPGTTSEVNLSEHERKQLFRLWVESMALDFLLPIITDAISVAGVISPSDGSVLLDPLSWDQVISFLIANIDQVQNVKPYLSRGDYNGATKEYLTFLWTEAGKATLSDLSVVVNSVLLDVLESRFKLPDYGSLSKINKKVLRVLQIADLAIKSTDYMRMVYHIANSSHGEEWELTVREIPMNMIPERFSISPINQRQLKVNILSTIADDQVIEYAWETTGKYGYLWDERDHKGTMFSSSLNEAYYFCNADRLRIPENAKDTVTVTAYIKQGINRTKVGTVQTIVSVTNLRVFSVPFEPHVPVSNIFPGEYVVAGPRFIAKFPERDDARSYQLRIVNSAGVAGAPLTRTPSQIPIINGMHEFGISIGSPSISFVNAQQRDILVAKYMEQLSAVSGTYAFLEVTVIPK